MGVKRTSAECHEMSANDPKRTSSFIDTVSLASETRNLCFPVRYGNAAIARLW
jgi:hypothetical protein